MGNRVRVKSLRMAQGLANARPPGSAKFANAPPPGLTRQGNAPQLPVGGVGLGAGGIDWCIILILIYYSYSLQKYFAENIEAIWAGSLKMWAKIDIQEQFSVRLTLQTSLLMLHDMFPPSAFQFGFLPLKPYFFPLKSSLESLLQRGKPKFIM